MNRIAKFTDSDCDRRKKFFPGIADKLMGQSLGFSNRISRCNRHENIYNVSNITGCNALIIFIDLLRQRIRNIVFLILEDVHPVLTVTLNTN